MTRTWTVSPLGRYGALAVIAVLSTSLGGALAVDAGVGAGVFAASVVAAVGAPMWAIFSVRPRITLTTTELVIRNPPSSQRIPLADLSSVQGGWGGLTIVTSSGDVAAAWAVQKSNYARWFHRRTRADDAADEIMAAAQATQATAACIAGAATSKSTINGLDSVTPARFAAG